MLTKTISFIKQKTVRIYHLPKKYTIGGTLGIIVLTILAVGLWPRTIDLAYSGESCISHALVAPGMYKSVGSDHFSLTPKGGTAGVLSRNLCAVARTAPTAGEYHVILSLFGLPVGKQVTVRVTQPPQLARTALSKPVPVTKPIKLQLSDADTLFTYKLQVGEKTAACTSASATVVCGVDKLVLEQGSEYTAKLSRYFGEKKVTTVAEKKIQTLSAVAVTDTTIKVGQTVYDKPKSMQVTFDKSVVSASATLEPVNAPDAKKIDTTIERSADGRGLTVNWTQDLERMKEYQMVLDKVTAADDSSLIEPYKVAFKVSGGPKVTSVSVPRTGISMGSTAAITFDQPLSDKQDIGKLVTLSGGATFAGVQGNRISVNLAGVAKCSDFTIKIAPDIQSKYDVGGQSAYDFAGRMVCHTVGSIGTSSRGRPITAYYFGSGPTSIIYTGAIHGSEASTRSLMLRWIDELEANARSIPADKSIVVIPALNPDGIASGSRTNANNVDLNRNFGTSDWKTDITTVNNAPFPKGGGSAPMSEPETKAIASLVSRLRPQLVLSYHSIGGVLAANQVGSSTTYARTYANLSGYSNVTGSSTTFEYAISGTADDYYGEKLGVASVLIELGSHSYHQFERNQKAMWAMIK